MPGAGGRRFWSRWLGARGEREAARWLRSQGYRIITRGYSTSAGEIDLIARDGDVLVFVEVKTRQQGNPAEAVDAGKQRRLTLAALHFLRHHRLLNAPGVRGRFDVVAIVWPEGGGTPRIDHIRGAFDAVGQGQFFR
ncbi:YraN family protein [Isosphaeraceae bacterium EP7]